MKQIYIVSNHAMFGRGLESLLREEENVNIVGQETNIKRAIERIKTIRPDVVILDTDSPASEVMPILREIPGVKVVGLSLQNNQLHVYQAQQRVATGVQDLLDAVKGDTSDPTTIVYKNPPQSFDDGLSAQTG